MREGSESLAIGVGNQGTRDMRKIIAAALGGAALVAIAQPAQAALLTGTFAINAYEGVRNGSGFSAADANPFTGDNTASASFTYTGSINFSNRSPQSTGPTGDLNSAFGFSASNISGYTGSGTVTYGGAQVADFRTVTGFLGSSGSSSSFQYGSYYSINLGSLAAGTVVRITHDDGAAFFQGNTRIDNTQAGPTGETTSTFTVQNTGNTILRYTRQNGTPSVLIVDVSAVPEPATWAMMIVGFGMVGGVARYRRRESKVTYA